MARRKHEPPASTEPEKPIFETEADAEKYVVFCVSRLQALGPVDHKGRAVSKARLLRLMSIEHAGIDLDSLDRYLVNLLSDGRLGVTAGRWWVRRKAPPVLVLGLFVLLTGCGSSFSTAASMDGVAGSTDVGTAGASGETMAAPGGTAGASGETMAAPGGTAGATLGSAGAPALGTGGAPQASAGAPALGTGGSTGIRWPACLASGCGSTCRTLAGQGWCDVMARCLTDNGCIASDQPNCTDCSALPDGIDCECAP